jgi:Flp pilus assembly protein TadD
MAWVLATSTEASVRNGGDAVEFAERAVRLSGAREPTVLGTLAAAYAEAGRFREAVEVTQRAVALARQQNKESIARDLSARSASYEAKRPLRAGR